MTEEEKETFKEFNKLIKVGQKEAEWEIINLFIKELNSLLISFEKGGSYYDVFIQENMKSDWDKGHDAGTQNIINRLEYKLQDIKNKLGVKFIDKWGYLTLFKPSKFN